MAALGAGQPCALVSIVDVQGSAPREAGTRMLVRLDAVIGSIGGGNLEFQAIRQARAALAHPPGSWRLQDYPLGPLLGQCCGGRVRLLIDRLDPGRQDWLRDWPQAAPQWLETSLIPGRLERRLLSQADGVSSAARLLEPTHTAATPLLLLGAGHVAQALVRILADLPLALTWHDNRESFATPPAILSTAEAMAAAARRARHLVLIMTHDHALDYQLAAAALAGDATFIGLIGSASKRARFRSRLARDGLAPAALDRLICPIGLAGIPGKDPAIIAVAVAAQLLQARAGEITA